MRAVDVEDNIRYVDKVVEWRWLELCRLFPEMPEEKREEIVYRADSFMLERAKKLAADGCPHELAYQILR